MDLSDRFAGCLLGGAVGDALGAPVEFMSLAEIRSRFGADGIQSYAPAYGRVGAITDDTQMTMFTAEGLIRAQNRMSERGICNPVAVVRRAYLRWLGTQGEMRFDPEFPGEHSGWLYQQPELHASRAPGNACLSALRSGSYGTMEKPINNSKGCGGIMRVAPVGLIANDPFRLGCKVAAITHGHPSGYLAAGFLALTIAAIIHDQELPAAIDSARQALQKWPTHAECLAAVDTALLLAERADATPEVIEQMGEGWVAEEALAISLFCALKAKDFIGGVRLAVNHGGDSDSTGAITGNILGAMLGKSAIPTAFLAALELREVIEILSQDLLGVVYRHAEAAEPNYERYPPW